MQHKNHQHQSTLTKKNVGYIYNSQITLLLDSFLSPCHQLIPSAPMLIHCGALARRQFNSTILCSSTAGFQQGFVLSNSLPFRPITSCHARCTCSILYKKHHYNSFHIISGTWYWKKTNSKNYNSKNCEHSQYWMKRGLPLREVDVNHFSLLALFGALFRA